MSIIYCHRCGTHVDTDFVETDPDGEVCGNCAEKCKECGVDIDPEDTPRDCADCRATVGMHASAHHPAVKAAP